MAADDLNASVAPQEGHRYLLKSSGFGRHLAATAASFALVTALLWGAIRSGVLPGEAHLADPDSTIIATKARLASRPGGESIAFVGDSSCLINIDIPTLRQQGIAAVNLGTLSYLGIDSFGLLARRFCEGRPGAEIVLVVHPECLRLTEPSVEHRAILESALESQGAPISGGGWNRFQRETFDGFRTRMLDRWIPTPLRGRMGERYGFTQDLGASLVSTGGTMEETAVFDAAAPHGSAEYRLARRIRPECEAFRSRLPDGVRVRVIISPVPSSHALKSHEATVTQLGREVSRWIQADESAGAMPLVMPDSDFGTVTHLLPSAARTYSGILARKILEK